MKNIWAIICEKSLIDSQTNLISLFNCIEEISIEVDMNKMNSNQRINIPLNFQLISLWLVEDNKQKDNEIKVEFVDPKNQVLNEFKVNIQTKLGAKRMRNITNIQGIHIINEGRYYYKIYKKEGNKFVYETEIPLDVNISYKILNNK